MYGLSINRNSQIPVARQIYTHLSNLILFAHLAAGDILPSSRELAKNLGVSRNTIADAYEMLRVKGYVQCRKGARFRVGNDIRLKREAAPPKNAPRKSHYIPQKSAPYDFRVGIPDLAHFPFAEWKKSHRAMLALGPGDMLYGNVQGYEPLRKSIARWLLRSRGMQVDHRDVFITSGATQAINIAIDILYEKGKTFFVENPCLFIVPRMLRLKNIRTEAVEVDEQGPVIDELAGKNPCGMYVTPSHQFPLGHVMSASRRTQCVDIARKKDFCIIEDDYDGEFRYDGLPLAPLFPLAPEHVIYVGTFSKTLYPALRLGFAVVPRRFGEEWSKRRLLADMQGPIGEQALLHDFLERRILDSHVKKMTKVYAYRRSLLLDAVQSTFGNEAKVLGDRAGLHVAIRVRGSVFDRRFKDRCEKKGILAMPCSRHVPGDTGRYSDVLLLGFGNANPENIHAGIAELRNMLR